MLTYQVRKRMLSMPDGPPPSWPADAEIAFHFLPKQPFGMHPGDGRTLVAGGTGTSVLFNLNTGVHNAQMKTRLPPLDVTLENSDRLVVLKGNVLTIRKTFATVAEMLGELESVYFLYPMLLNTEFGDPPIVGHVNGKIGEKPFNWLLGKFNARIRLTSQSEQESIAASAWAYLNVVTPAARRRILAALHYLHVACRLSRRGERPGEFLAEAILNYNKILEALFEPSGKGMTRDGARAGLSKLGFTAEEIEGKFIPAMLLRNELGVGHVDLRVYTTEQLTVLHAYVERSEDSFRELLSKVLRAVAGGTFEAEPYEFKTVPKKILDIIELLRQRIPESELQ